MDTLEYRSDTRHGEVESYRGPILWRDKTPQQVCREQYPDCTLKQRTVGPKSLRGDAHYCDEYLVRAPDKEDGNHGGVYSVLIPIPEKTV